MPNTDKKALRKEYRERLAGLDAAHRAALSAAVRSHLAAWPAFRAARHLVAFYPMAGEPDFVPLLVRSIAAGHRVGLVRTAEADGGLLEVRLWDGSPARLENHPRMPLRQASPRLPELDDPAWRVPRAEAAGWPRELLAADAGIVLVPGLAFGRDGGRLGHGAGWYDRFLKSVPGLLRVGVGFGLQLRDGLPSDPWDEALDFFVCEEGVAPCP